MTAKVVGLTGGIACGKSTVAHFFRELGVPIVDADELARKVVEPGTDGLAEVVQSFGSDVLAADGSLDRKKLGDIVFGDATLRKKLNAIIHPRVGMASAEAIAALQVQNPPYILYEAALIVENGLHRGFDALIVVKLEEPVQIERLMARDKSTKEAAQARVASQLPLAEKLVVADFVIDNGGSEEATRKQVQSVHESLLSRSKARP